MAQHQGETFRIDANTVHTLLVNFIAGNETAEAKIQHLSNLNNGRKDYEALKDHYEGVGVHSKDITKAVDKIDNMFYAGEKPPHMWWDEFEKELNWAFTTCDINEGRTVHSNEMKLRILLKKIKADFLAATKAGINIELSCLDCL